MAFPVDVVAALQAAAPEATRVLLERTWLDQVALIGQSLTSILVLILLIAATFALLSLRRALDELTRLVRSSSADITAAIHDAREVADELRRMTGRVRDTVDVLGAGAKRVRSAIVGKPTEGAAAPTDAAPRERDRDRDARRRRKRRRGGLRGEGGERPRAAEGAEGSAPGEGAEGA
jgi:hypothetical protein